MAGSLHRIIVPQINEAALEQGCFELAFQLPFAPLLTEGYTQVELAFFAASETDCNW